MVEVDSFLVCWVVVCGCLPWGGGVDGGRWLRREGCWLVWPIGLGCEEAGGRRWLQREGFWFMLVRLRWKLFQRRCLCPRGGLPIAWLVVCCVSPLPPPPDLAAMCFCRMNIGREEGTVAGRLLLLQEIGGGDVVGVGRVVGNWLLQVGCSGMLDLFLSQNLL